MVRVDRCDVEFFALGGNRTNHVSDVRLSQTRVEACFGGYELQTTPAVDVVGIGACGGI